MAEIPRIHANGSNLCKDCEDHSGVDRDKTSSVDVTTGLEGYTQVCKVELTIQLVIYGISNEVI